MSNMAEKDYKRKMSLQLQSIESPSNLPTRRSVYKQICIIVEICPQRQIFYIKMFFGTFKENLKIGGPGLRLKRVHFVHWFLVAAKLILPLRLMRLARLVRRKVMMSVSLQSGKENF